MNVTRGRPLRWSTVRSLKPPEERRLRRFRGASERWVLGPAADPGTCASCACSGKAGPPVSPVCGFGCFPGFRRGTTKGASGPGRPVTGASRWYGFLLDRNPRGCGVSRASARVTGNTGEGSPRDERRERREGGARLRRFEPEARQRRENRRTDVEDEAPEDVRNVGRGKALSGGGTPGDGFGRHRRLDAPSYVARAETPGEAPRGPRVHA